MANEEVLRLRTTIVSDEALAQIRAIGREIGLMPAKAKPHVDNVNKSFVALSGTVKKLGGEIMTVVPALGSLGFGAAGAGAAMAVLMATLQSAAKRIVELEYASKELGMSERDIRAWSSTAEKAGVSAQSMMQGMEAFKKTTDGLKYNIGGARDELYAMGAGPIVQRMQAAVTQAEKMKVAFKFKDELMKDDPSGFKARMFFDQIGLGADKARLPFEQYERAQAKLKPVSPEDQEKAQKFADSMVELGEAWDQLVIKTGVALFPGLTTAINGLSSLLDKINAIDDAWDKWARGPSGKGTVLGKIIPGYDEQPNLNPRSGYRPPAAAPTGEEGSSNWSFNSPNRNPRSGYHGPGRRAGGPVFGGLPYTVGENGPETFVPGLSGRISSGGNRDEGVRTVKEGVFQALVDFKSYVETGSGGGDGGGGSAGTLASFGGSAGAAAGGGVSGGGGGGGGGAGTGVGTGTNGGGGSGGGSGNAAPAGSSVPGGTGTGELPGSVPKDVMQTARNMLQRGASTGQLQKFMADNGYPRSGNWCGQFAASVVKSAGGAPPKGAGVASNWLNWGQHVDPKDVQEGDIMVRKSSRFGGQIQPGQIGSHVAFAGGAVKDGKVEMVGGNQGGIRAGVNASQYEFRRGQEKQATAEKTGAAVPGGQPAGGTPAGGGRVTRFSEDVNAAITSGAAQAGVSPRMMGAVASIESSGKPGAQTGSYKGLFQLSESEFRKLKSEQAQLSAKLGRPVTEAEVYMAHQQGVGGATQHITHPDQPAWMSMYNTAEGRQKGAGWAKKAIWGNVPAQYKKKFGSVDNITSGQFTGMWADRYARATGTDRIDKAVDTAAAGGTKAEGNVKVQIESNGTAAKAKASTDGGLWQKSTIENYRQMQPTSKPVHTVEQPISA
jgi:hypothetical protein